MITKDELFRCFECKKNYKKEFNNELLKVLQIYTNFVMEILINLFWLLRKGVYPYEYMDSWERFDETLLPDKEAFYSSLNMKDVTDVDHRHAKRVFKSLNLGDYHDLYVQSDTLLLADVFENFRNMCIEIYDLDPSQFLSAIGLPWKAFLKRTEIELELITDFNMLLMVEQGIQGGICHKIFGNAKANNKFMKNYGKNEESSFVEYLDANNLYGWVISQK